MRLLRSVLVACALVACVKIDDLGTPRRETPTTPGAKETEVDPPIIEDGFCENGSLDYGPLALPPAVKGREYEAKVSEWADDDWWGTFYYESSLPPGLVLGGDEHHLGSLVIRGTPTESGRFEVRLYAGHDVDSNGCSTMPDPHTFEIEIYETDLDAGTDGGD